VDAVDAPVPRRLAVLRAALSDLLTDPALAPHEGAWCQVTLTDAERPREAMAAVRGRFPHTLELRWEPVARQGDRLPYAARARGRDDVEVCCGFLEHVRGRRADGAEEALLRAAVEAGRIAEAQERGVAPLRPRRGRGGHVPPGVPHDAMPARDAG
jgi:exonuclease SbcD